MPSPVNRLYDQPGPRLGEVPDVLGPAACNKCQTFPKATAGHNIMPKVSAKRSFGTRLFRLLNRSRRCRCECQETLGFHFLMCAKGPFFEWDTEAMDEENIGGMHLRLMMRSKTQFQFFLTSQKKKDVPNSDQHTLNIFLQKAMNNMEESIKRGSNGSAKAFLCCKDCQKQARRTENHHTQQKRKALEEGWQGGNLITKLFPAKGGHSHNSCPRRPGHI